MIYTDITGIYVEVIHKANIFAKLIDNKNMLSILKDFFLIPEFLFFLLQITKENRDSILNDITAALTMSLKDNT